MEKFIPTDWYSFLESTLQQTYFQNLSDFVEKEYVSFRCYPPKEMIFSAFKYFPPSETKVVIIGQDPYHGHGQANGLCFSVNDGMAFPPSLQNIFKELERDLDIPIAISGNLERWAEQGVLLLNATLTVRENLAGSHQGKGWETFTNYVIKELSNQNEQLIFILWGNYAQQKTKFIDEKKHIILKSGHPSPLSANRGLWFGNGHFGKVNELLRKQSKTTIDW
ncbi:uracil-DNA glycosylase [Flavobacterium filum]|uniref:uracil-DNA glycosylase n=1 Tax=Flavobacterium TaxID=237 RepID=UPI000409D893|nr:uracil-DNA glycosylase [Flavobacterium filum]